MLVGLAVVVLAGTTLVTVDVVGHHSSSFTTPALPQSRGTREASRTISSRSCPWLTRAEAAGDSPSQLAAMVVARMTSREKLGEVVLKADANYENFDAGSVRLCIPSLTLQDGPAGLAAGAVGVTQLPSPLGVGATFDPAVATAYGKVEGEQSHKQGIDVIQGPNLNVDRVPWNGRAFEGYGEDPSLIAAMGVADIEGIRAGGADANIKHLVAYTQETDRASLNDVVPDRALHELYLSPFEAAIEQGHADSIMCAYGKLDGTYQCQDAQLVSMLQQWGFTGYIRTDLGAAADPAAALAAGVDLVKPASVSLLAADIADGRLAMSAVDAAVTRVLTRMFALGLVQHPDTGSPSVRPETPANRTTALQTAERSTVLLRNAGGVLPLPTGAADSVAVIGADASTDPVTAGGGSAWVEPNNTVTPLQAITARAGTSTAVTYADGGSATSSLPVVPPAYLTPATGSGTGLTLNVTADGVARPFLARVTPTVDTRLDLLAPALRQRIRELPTHPNQGPHAPDVTQTRISLPVSSSNVTATWTGTITPPRTGLYSFSLRDSGGAQLFIGDTLVVDNSGDHFPISWTGTIELTAGHAYPVRVAWIPDLGWSAVGPVVGGTGTIRLGWQFDSDLIDQAVAAARAASTAVVFVAAPSSESADRPSLSLPGDQDTLIEAVARANPRTVVVINSSGPILMPWLSQVAGVVEAWFPGEEDGAAAAAVLYGDVDPSGHLPVTFPTSESATSINTPSQWPGILGTSTFSEGLDVGYRYNEATGIAPLFPFGFGLSYTTFALSDLSVTQTSGGLQAQVTVTDTGPVAGRAVPQAYLTFPDAAGEPPRKLVAFASVSLAPGASTTVTLNVPSSATDVWLNGASTVVPGTYRLEVGQSSADLPLSDEVAIS